jgi:hypothetical protein
MRDETTIRVHARWDAWESAELRLDDLEDLHWLQPVGAPRPLLHAYVSCARIESGSIPHECASENAPHRLLICIVKTHVPVLTYIELVRRSRFPGGRRSRDREPVSP